MRDLLVRLRASPRTTRRLFAASAAANLLALASSFYVMLVLNRYVAHGVDATLAMLTAGVVGTVLFEHAFRQVRLRIAANFGRAAHERTAAGAFGVLLTARASGLGRFGSAQQRETLRGVDLLDNAFGPANLAALFDVPFAILFIAIILLASWPLALVCLVFVGLSVGAGLLGQASLRGPGQEASQAAMETQRLVETGIENRDSVRAFGGLGRLMTEWSRAVRAARLARERMSLAQGRAQSVVQTLQSLQGVFIIAVGAVLVVRGQLDVGTLIGINILAARAIAPINRVVPIGEAVAMARQARARLEEWSRLPVEPSAGSTLAALSGALELRDVTYTPPGAAAPLLKHLSFRLPPGAVLAVKGRNGAGKSTLLRLVAGLIEPQEGAVLADGVDLRRFAPDWWRRQLCYLPQEPTFLDLTIRGNFLAARPDLDEAAMAAALASAGADRFVANTAEGLDTRVRAAGREFAVGHRRRLALARALAVGGRFVLFDEPTEGLDAEGTAQVYRVLVELARAGHTVIVASHDPRILQGASQLLDLDAPAGGPVAAPAEAARA